MSIFSSLGAPNDDEHEDNCTIWTKNDGIWDIEEGAVCSCGRPDAPIVYQGSHILPSQDDERGGHVDIALIPSHITRDGRDDRPEDEAPWPFLRMGVNSETVILTRRNVLEIVESLTYWLGEVNE